MSTCENLQILGPTEAQEDTFTRILAVIQCEKDDVIVDWSSGVLKTNIGESNSNRTREGRDRREPIGVSAREE